MPVFRYESEVRFQDVDGARVVFFSRILEYFHDALAAFLGELGFPLSDRILAGDWWMPIRRAEADYRRPIRLGEAFRVEILALRVEETQVRFDYRLVTETSGDPAAVGRTIHVCVDPATLRRRAFPAEVRAAWERAASGKG